MPRDPRVLIFVGIKHAVVALDERSGVEVWRASLHSGEYVSVLWDGQALLAANAGEVWRLDPESGAVLWRNEMKGLGRGLASLASSRQAGAAAPIDLAAQKHRRVSREEGSA